MATYKAFNEVQSEEAIYTLKEPEKPKPPENPDDGEEENTCPTEAPLNTTTNKCECTDKSKTYDETSKTCK